MKIKIWIAACIALCTVSCAILKNGGKKTASAYNIAKLKEPMTIDANWDKPQWQSVEAVELKYFMGEIPKFRPVVQAKMMYDNKNLYVIFRVKERYTLCVTKDINGPVWEDSAVEFFFSPDSSSSEKYFNLEINCCGTPLMHYNLIPKKDYKILESDDIKQIEIAHSLPEQVINKIIDPVTWTIEYKIPIDLLEKHAKVSRPGPGVIWRANFYKIAHKTSNPHYMTWSFIQQAKPDFHLPQYFGKLIFQ